MSTPENSLHLRTAENDQDVERVAAFNTEIHGERAGAMLRNLFLHHPNTHLDDLVLVEDETNGEVVSSLCLVPWTWRYEGVELPVGEMGFVGTLESYRGRGLVRAQVERFKQRLRERGCLLSQIQGIPYFYRQFGYEYALPLEGGLRLELRQIPKPPEAGFTFRQATESDLPTLMQLYDEAARDLAIHTARDEATWRYLLQHTAGTEMEREIWIVEDGEKHAAGYVCLPAHHFGQQQPVSETSRLSFDAALAVLDQVKTLAAEREKPGIRLNLPANCSLMQTARSLIGRDPTTYAWQIHLPDVAALLRALAPVLERRIAASPLAGLTRDLRICLYRETISLRFEEGKLDEVTNLGFAAWEKEPIRLPPLQFTPLVLGHRTREELQAAYPDIHVAPKLRMLVDTLFPRMVSFIYTMY